MKKIYRVLREDWGYGKKKIPIGFFDTKEEAENCVSYWIKKDGYCETHGCISYFIEEEYRSDKEKTND